VRDFARATGQLAKTDALDARMLALFGERLRPELRALPTEQERELKALVARRRERVNEGAGAGDSTIPELTAKALTERIELPLLWNEQERALGIR
jgi:transposase